MATGARNRTIETLVLAFPETAGAALYGLIDVLTSAGLIWAKMMRSESASLPFNVRIASTGARPFRCGNGIPVSPHVAIRDDPAADIIIIPQLWLGPDEHLGGRHTEVTAWIRERYAAGAFVYSVCSAALLLAETGLLDGRQATSHWGYQQLFERRYPQIHFRSGPSLCFADTSGRLVTAGGSTAWHDLALHIISRHVNAGEALRIAKVYLLKTHAEGQLPYGPVVKPQRHTDAIVRACESWLTKHYREAGGRRRAHVQASIQGCDRRQPDRLRAEPSG
jgi:transcriptional regulator GlxA family with amidase domain